MEKEDKQIKQIVKKNGVTNGFQHKPIILDFQNVTCIDLSSKDILNLDTVQFPANLLQLNLSRNNLSKVPAVVLNQNKLKILDISGNQIEYFDDSPAFCHTLERLDISNNNLKGPPYWIWAKTAKNLTHLNISNNPRISLSFVNGYFEELLTYTTNIIELQVYNCKLQKHTQLLGTCPKLRKLVFGCKDFRFLSCNSVIDTPYDGLNKCHDIESLILCNTNIYTLNRTIELYNKIVELNLSSNWLYCLPNEFCNLSNLEICTLSSNKIQYLPDNLSKLSKLKVLLLSENELYAIPDISEMCNLKTLDLYDNHLYDIPSCSQLDEFDVALNYLDEPDDEEYLEKRSKLRLLHDYKRSDGRKPEVDNPESENSSKSDLEDDDDECYQICLNNTQELDKQVEDQSSDEDWDSDEYWIPCNLKHPTPPPESPWIYYVKKKMEEGNFCPMDAHKISVADKVKFHKICYPEVIYESDGQYDDFSSDDS